MPTNIPSQFKLLEAKYFAAETLPEKIKALEEYHSVTILVTVKNMRETIENCVKSLLNLNYSNYKIFITDAYSTDGGFEILKKLEEKHPEKIKLEQIRGGIAVAQNYMINKTSTDFIAMTDADCFVDKNWLKNLISAFTSNDIIASTGFCSTPKSAKGFQKLIGLELEDRFKHAPNFVPRGPTMNIAVRTKFAKKVKFDERFDVAQETDWGYRLTSFGKMIYVPEAIVFHYHRPTLNSYLKQNGFRYGRATPLLYLKNMKKISGDYITKPIILLQEYTFWFFGLFALLSIFYNSLLSTLAIISAFLIFLYLIDIMRFTKKLSYIASFVLLYFLRNIIYTLGMIVGIFDLIIKRIKEL